MHACIHTYIHTYIHTCIHTYMYVRMHTHTHLHNITYVHTCTLNPSRGRAEEMVYIAAKCLGIHLEPLNAHVNLHTPTDGAKAAGPCGLGQCPHVCPQVGREVHLYLWHALQFLQHCPRACGQGLLLVVGAS